MQNATLTLGEPGGEERRGEEKGELIFFLSWGSELTSVRLGTGWEALRPEPQALGSVPPLWLREG